MADSTGTPLFGSILNQKTVPTGNANTTSKDYYGGNLSTSSDILDQNKVCRFYIDGWGTEGIRIPSGFLPTGSDKLKDIIIGPKSMLVAGNPYFRFMVDGINFSYQETVVTMKNFTAGFTTYVFGQEPPIATFNGILLNTDSDKWSEYFLGVYSTVLRAPKLAELSIINKKDFFVVMKYQGKIMKGSFISFSKASTAQLETGVRFNFQFLVKSLELEWSSVTLFGKEDPNEEAKDATSSGAKMSIETRQEGATQTVPAKTDVAEGSPVQNSPNTNPLFTEDAR